MKAVFPYFGGKTRLVKYILQYVPAHEVYVEVFGGAGALLLAKPPSKLEVYNDINSLVVNFFRVLRDEEKSKKLIQLLELTPYAREEYNECRKIVQGKKEVQDDVEKARAFFVCACQAFGGNFSTGWGYNLTPQRNIVVTFLSSVQNLYTVSQRLRRVQIENIDFREMLKKYDRAETFFYLDPPYVPGTRRTKKIYQYEMTREDHHELTNLLLNLKGQAILSGYRDEEIHAPLEQAGWKKVDIAWKCYAVHAKHGRPPRTESLWIKTHTEELFTNKKKKGDDIYVYATLS
jgi:DNA adenine methylase